MVAPDGIKFTCNARDSGSIPRPGRSPGGGSGNPLQHSCLENPMDRGARRATVRGVAKSQTRLSNENNKNPREAAVMMLGLPPVTHSSPELPLHSPTTAAVPTCDVDLLVSAKTDAVSAQALRHVRLCDPVDRSPPGSSVHGILQARTLEWVAISSFRESSRPRDLASPALAGRFFTSSCFFG